MCENCNYEELLERAGIQITANRVHVLEAIGSNSYPLTAADVYTVVHRQQSINRVTVYRILDLLVKKSILEKLPPYSKVPAYTKRQTYCLDQIGSQEKDLDFMTMAIRIEIMTIIVKPQFTSVYL